jgi:beta-glucosidase
MRRVHWALVLALPLPGFGCGRQDTACPRFELPPATEAPADRAQAVLSQLTREDELQLVHGAASRNWPREVQPRRALGTVTALSCARTPTLYFADGSVGVRDQVGRATALPSGVASAATWDVGEAAKFGTLIGTEQRAFGINVSLSGTLNLSGREPRGGRTFESKGEDPILAGKITAALVRAIQDQHVIANLKHFALNDQETGRGNANVLIDERSARESDLLAFEIASKDSDVQSVMCSYNLVNGHYACQNPWLLSTVLDGDWGFPGFVVSDWDAVHDTLEAANGGLDEEQPDSNYFGSLGSAVADGDVPQARLDDMVRRILHAMFSVGLFDEPEALQPIAAEDDARVAEEIEEQGAVLLQNSGVLPLARSLTSIAVIGSHADVGVLSGGGSAQVDPYGGAALVETPLNAASWLRVVWDPSSPLDALQAKVPNGHVSFNDGSDPESAAALAAASDVAVVFVSQWEAESLDRPSLQVRDIVHEPAFDQDALVSAVAAANPKTIVVLESGGAQLMPWLGSTAAVLEAWYPGQRGGEAIANLLFGDVNPSGKLPLTFPARDSDLPRPVLDAPQGPVASFDVDYDVEGFNAGYKWYASRGLTPLFPFGFGLSYTTFEITEPQVTVTDASGPSDFQVSFVLGNTGARAGAEVAQVYLQLPEGTGEAKRLVAWQKVLLGPGEEQTVTVPVAADDSSHPLSYWDESVQGWRAASGSYTVYVGTSSRDLVQAGSFAIP